MPDEISDHIERVRRRLEDVTDPGTNMNVMSMGIIRNLTMTEDGVLTMQLRPSSTVCPLVVPLAFRIKKAIEELEGINIVKITVVDHRMAESVTAMLNEGDGHS